MKHDSIRSGQRKPVNLSLDTGVVEAARALGINLSQTCETALREATALASPDDAIQVDHRLTPLLDIAGQELLMLTHFAAAVPTNTLGRPSASVADQMFIVSNALDMLISGY